MLDQDFNKRKNTGHGKTKEDPGETYAQAA
jgi:hypothetical protein